jgi:hypothetical protein
MQHLAASDAETSDGCGRQHASQASASRIGFPGNFTPAESATHELRLNGPPKLHLE